MSERCLYLPTEAGLCATCGRPSNGVECPMTGGTLVVEGSLAHASRNLRDACAAFGAGAAAALGLVPLLKTLSELIERTADDDRI